MKKTSHLAFCSIAASLNVLFLIFSNFIPFLNYSICFLCGCLITAIALEINLKSAFLVYFVVSIACIFTIFSNYNVFLYIAFVGHYPIIKLLLNRLKKAIKILVKFLILLAIAFLLNLAYFSIFAAINKNGIITLALNKNGIFHLALILTFLVLMAYDFLISSFIVFYNNKLKGKFFKN